MRFALHAVTHRIVGVCFRSAACVSDIGDTVEGVVEVGDGGLDQPILEIVGEGICSVTCDVTVVVVIESSTIDAREPVVSVIDIIARFADFLR